LRSEFSAKASFTFPKPSSRRPLTSTIGGPGRRQPSAAWGASPGPVVVAPVPPYREATIASRPVNRTRRRLLAGQPSKGAP
jgi:hypothetical protein